MKVPTIRCSYRKLHRGMKRGKIYIMGAGRCEIEFGCQRYPSPWVICPLAKPRDWCPLNTTPSFTLEELAKIQKWRMEQDFQREHPEMIPYLEGLRENPPKVLKFA